MIERTIEDIAKFCNGEMNSRAEDMKTAIVKGVSIDTRTIEAGNIFIPFRGENADGHRFIKMAFEKGAGLTLRDRKSTRLNSSHVSISYAVFCLKKKKNINR